MKSLRITFAAILAILAGAVVSGQAQTQLLNLSGGTLEGSLTNQELIGNPPNAGQNFGVVSSWVVSDSSIDSSGYIFIYQLVNNSSDTFNGLTFDGFSASMLVGTSSGSYSNIIGTLSLPYALPASPQGSFTFQEISPGGAATFQDGNLSNGGATSWFLVVDTDVNSFQDNIATTQDGSTSEGDILAPLAVPEPSSSLVLLGGLAPLYLLIRCRREGMKS